MVAKHWRLAVVVIACAALMALPPSYALAGHTGHTHATYATATGNINTYYTASWNGRSFNRAWHASGYYWEVFYLKTDGSTSGYAWGYANPTHSTFTASYAKSACSNFEDAFSGVQWTCETNTSA